MHVTAVCMSQHLSPFDDQTIIIKTNISHLPINKCWYILLYLVSTMLFRCAKLIYIFTSPHKIISIFLTICVTAKSCWKDQSYATQFKYCIYYFNNYHYCIHLPAEPSHTDGFLSVALILFWMYSWTSRLFKK